MIRVLICAATEEQEAALAALLAEEDRLEVIDASEAVSADVVLLSGGQTAPREVATTPSVILTDDIFETSDYRSAVRARLPSGTTAAELLAALTAAAQGFVVLTQPQADALYAHPTVPPAATAD